MRLFNMYTFNTPICYYSDIVDDSSFTVKHISIVSVSFIRPLYTFITHGSVITDR